MQVFPLCLLFLAMGSLLVPGIALSKQISNFRNIEASSMSEYQGADREQSPIRVASNFQQNSDKRRGIFAVVAMAAPAIA